MSSVMCVSFQEHTLFLICIQKCGDGLKKRRQNVKKRSHDINKNDNRILFPFFMLIFLSMLLIRFRTEKSSFKYTISI